MFATRAGRRRAVAYGVLLSASLLLLAVSSTPPLLELRRGVGFALAPVQAALAGLTRSATGFFGTLAEIERLAAANASLATRNQVLEERNRADVELRNENRQLTALLGVGDALGLESVTATVVGRGASLAERVIALDKGSERGIAVGDVVVGAGGALVGRVYEAGTGYSRILLISDTRMNVIGLTATTRASGQVQGQLGGNLAMTQIASTATVNEGDDVVTAGIDLGGGLRSPYPKGLLIGRIVFVQRDPSAVVQTALVEPAALLDELEYVVVITGYQGGLPAAPSASPSPSASPGRSPASSPGGGVPPGLPSPSLGAAPGLPSPSLGTPP